DAAQRIKRAVLSSLAEAKPRPVGRLAALKRPFKFKVRQFDEATEDAAVVQYCQNHVGTSGEQIIEVFRNMRKTLALDRGKERETWLQSICLGDVAIVLVRLRRGKGITLKTEIALSRSQRRAPRKKDFHVHDLGEVHLEDGREEFHGRAADVEVFHRQDADDSGGIYRAFAVRDGGD